ncbi:ABC transporter ATP-binding protein [Devosia faecipullorum]|uniref:ABC transporter ATP-binding protein n=1 Tax=Devosia faecipullorum TaxID=2755039 RepID=UPI00187B5179|nr:ABC transporter ATP-binding protein [Devosia faecipullorum]MBE7734133.1 ABC transporter ATP-binding protein [Devosia faecipullorum]
MQVEMSGITVRFGALTAVDQVSLRFAPGQIHAVVGENGAGKSTVMNVLFGMITPETGNIRIDGAEKRWRNPQDAIAARLGMVHQHFMLQDAMSVLENVVLCAEPTRIFGFVDFPAARRRLEEIARLYGIGVAVDRKVADLSVSERQIVEILKVLYRDAEMLILDEPTAVLTPQETENLFKILRNFRESGKSIALITHKLDEVVAIADWVSVMRGGKLVRSCAMADTSKDEIARGIIGGDLPSPLTRGGQAFGATVLKVENLSARRKGRTAGPVSFAVKRGEVVGIAGISGNGQSQIIEALVGLRRPLAGRITLLDRDVTEADVAGHRDAGLSYIPADRQTVGLALDARVYENAVIGREGTPAFSRGPLLNRPAMAGFARQLIERFTIKVAGPTARCSSMSGGNKQKLVVGRELARETPLIIAENPTWGVDIGAIDFIHRELIRMRDQGHAILLVSTELDEVLALSDRILVLYEGRIAGEFAAAEADRLAIGALMTSERAA